VVLAGPSTRASFGLNEHLRLSTNLSLRDSKILTQLRRESQKTSPYEPQQGTRFTRDTSFASTMVSTMSVQQPDIDRLSALPPELRLEIVHFLRKTSDRKLLSLVSKEWKDTVLPEFRKTFTSDLIETSSRNTTYRSACAATGRRDLSKPGSHYSKLKQTDYCYTSSSASGL
jgi:hypothetical protein